jgi:hypothetical protein
MQKMDIIGIQLMEVDAKWYLPYLHAVWTPDAFV